MPSVVDFPPFFGPCFKTVVVDAVGGYMQTGAASPTITL